MSPEPDPTTPGVRIIRFWPGMETALDLDAVVASAAPVKGVSYHTPLRFLQIYSEISAAADSLEHGSGASDVIRDLRPYSWRTIERVFLPRIPSVGVRLDRAPQPPYPWKDADPRFLVTSFIHITNAIFRILSLLAARGEIAPSDVDPLVDRACVLLARIYTARDHFLIRHINNNLNSYFISEVIERLVGKKCYDAEQQESQSTRDALHVALAMAPEHQNLTTLEKMGVALGKGVSFIESRLSRGDLGAEGSRQVRETAYRYFGSSLAIDHRHELLELVAEGGRTRNSFRLTAILDDTTESVDDLLWLADLLRQFPFLKVHLLLNTAQISVNFASAMLDTVLQHPCFRSLASRLGSQLLVTELYCPLISFQADLLPPHARKVIDRCDAVYIKGANFFETCQILEKHTFHAFVVFGPVSRAYTGLDDFSAVFVHLAPGTPGFLHRRRDEEIVTLRAIVSEHV